METKPLLTGTPARKSVSDFKIPNLDVDFKQCYDYSDDVYLSHCKRRLALDQLQLLYWAPSEGNTGDTITVILERTSSDILRGAMKVVFGQMPVETLICDHSSLSGARMPQTTTWMTLMAKVPNIELIQSNNQSKIPVYVVCYDYFKPNKIIGSCTVGTFTYHVSSFQQQARSQPYALQLSNNEPQKWTSAVSHLEEPSIDGKISQPSGSFNHIISNHKLSNELTKQNEAIFLWITQQLQIQWQQRHQQQKQQQQQYHQKRLDTSVPADDFYRHYLSTYPYDIGSHLEDETIQNYEQNFDAMDTSRSDYSRLNYSMNFTGHNYGSARQSQHPSYSATITKDNPMKRHCSNGSSISGRNGNYHPVKMDTGRYKHSHDHHIITNNGMNGAFNAPSYTGVLNKINLKICGNLMDMTYKWTASEWCSCRRLVRFWRRQNSSNLGTSQQVECGFEPIEHCNQPQQHSFHMNSAPRRSSTHDALLNSPSSHSDLRTELDANGKMLTTRSLVVSCIYWSERDDYYITSVDCIYLLEGLIGVQFSVEEKNRIRRNLEGFRPLTISKCKMDCADFFKLIMDFPHPKPRNIEKDVKVFAWKSLPYALQKIVRKYTAHYSKLNTSPMLSSPISSPQPLSISSFAYQHPLDSYS